MHKNFDVRTRVIITNLPDGDSLNGAKGIIGGLANPVALFIDLYIVILDEPLEDALAVCLPETCIDTIQ